jgi:hypothetical protein
LKKLSFFISFFFAFNYLSAQIYSHPNGNVGIGTTNPQAKFHVVSPLGGQVLLGGWNYGSMSLNGNTEDWNFASSEFDKNLYINRAWGRDMWFRVGNEANQMVLKANGFLGINTVNPSALIEIEHSGGSEWGTALQIKTTGGIDGPRLAFEKYTGGDPKRWNIGIREGGTSFGVFENGYSGGFGTERFTILPNGNVGIGTINPQAMLAVKGTVLALQVKVSAPTSGDWPDYVFAANYKLRSLSSLGAFIKKHQHLPDVPSAKQVKKGGLDLAETQAILLRKIEELTLYVIEQDKRIKNLESNKK